MFSKFGLYQTVAIGAVVVGVAGWAIYSQTDWFKPTPVIEASDTPLAVASDADDAEATTAEATPDELVEESETPTETVEETTEVEDTVEEAEAEESQGETPTASEAVEEDDDPVAVVEFPVPTFDVVRVESDGMTVVAGTGPAGWMISILVDGEAAETVVADGTGQFVAILDIGEAENARIITLSAKNGGTILMSNAQVIIAPVVRQVAETESEESTDEAVEETSNDETIVAENTAEEEAVNTVEADGIVGEATEIASNVDDNVTDESAIVDEPVADSAEEVADVTEEEEQPQVSSASESENAGEVADNAVETVADNAAETVEVTQATTESEPATKEEAAISETAAEEAVVEVAEASPATDETDSAEASSDEPAVEEEATPEEPVVEEQPVQVEVVEDSSPAVLLVENDSVTVLQPAASTPQVLDQLSIAAISYSDDGDVQISGFSPAGFLRVYLNNVQIAVLEVPMPGEWQAELVDVAPGIYTLRVDQVDEQGEVVQRVETPFKREEPAKVVEAAQSRKPLVLVEVVQPGSTLWAISRETYGSGVLYVNIFEANKDQIRSPHLIYPGQIFELPAPPGAKKKKRTSGQ